MANKWHILRGSVEQEILFPTKEIYNDYIKRLKNKEEPYEIISEREEKDGSVIVIMRKRYNYNNFLYSHER